MADETVKHGDDAEDLDALYAQVLSCDAAILETEMQPLADLIRSNDRFGRQWRLTALLAGKDGTFYREIADDADKAKTLAPTVGALSDFAKLLRTVADLADCVASRTAVAGCNHVDFVAWMEQEIA